jgi:CBS domain-containing protein
LIIKLFLEDDMGLFVRDVMSKGVLKLNKDQTIKEVNQIFLERMIDGAPVVDGAGKVIGVFTKTHLMRAMGRSPETPIGLLMNRNVISISEVMSIEKAMTIPVGRLPVVDADGKMIGWLTRTDLARAHVDYIKSIEGLCQIVDSTAHGIIAIDRNGKVTLFNKTAERLWDVTAEQIIGRQANQVFEALNIMDSVLKTGRPISSKLEVNKVVYSIDINPIWSDSNVNGAVAEFYRPTE